jgi:hypothetical protein
MDAEKILNLINKLGSELADYEYVWSDELRKHYEEVATYLSSC